MKRSNISKSLSETLVNFQSRKLTQNAERGVQNPFRATTPLPLLILIVFLSIFELSLSPKVPAYMASSPGDGGMLQ